MPSKQNNRLIGASQTAVIAAIFLLSSLTNSATSAHNAYAEEAPEAAATEANASTTKPKANEEKPKTSEVSKIKKDEESFWEHNKNAKYEKKAIEIKLGYATTTLVDIYVPEGTPQFISNGSAVGTGFGFNLGTGYSYYKDHVYLSAEILGQVWGGYSNPYFEGGSVGIRGKAGYNLFVKNTVVTLYKIAGLRAMVRALPEGSQSQYGYGLGIDLGTGVSVKSLSYDWLSVYFELAPTLYLGEGYLGGPMEFGVYIMPQITLGVQFEI